MPVLARVTMAPEIMVPKNNSGMDFFLGISNKNATNDPVQAPNSGKGTEAMTSKANSLYNSIFLAWFLRVWLYNQAKNLAKNLECLIKKSDTGFKNQD